MGLVVALQLGKQLRQFQVGCPRPAHGQGGFQITLGLAPQSLLQAQPPQGQQQAGVPGMLPQPVFGPGDAAAEFAPSMRP